MTLFLRYSLLALLKLFQWAPLLATLDPFSSIRRIDGDSTSLERHHFLWSNPPTNYPPASSNRSSHASALDPNFPPSSSAFTYALLISQHKHYLSNFVDSLALLYSEQLIYFNGGFCNILVLVALNLGLICLYSVTCQLQRNIHLLVPSWCSLKTIFTDRTKSVCTIPDQEAYNSDSGFLATKQDLLRAPNKHTLHDDLDSSEIHGAANLYNSRSVLPHGTSNDHSDTEHTPNHESGFCHHLVSLDVSPSLESLSSAGFEPVICGAKPSNPRPLPRPVHLVRNSPPPAEAVSHETARMHDTDRPARERDGAPHNGNPQIVLQRPDYGGYISVSSSQASLSSMVPQKRSWSHATALGSPDNSDLEEDGDSSFEEGSLVSESPGDQLALGLSLPRSNNENENHVTLRLSPSTSRRDDIKEHDSLCHSESTAMPFDVHRRSASTPAPSSRSSQHSVERDNSPSSGSERKFDGSDSFWEAAVQERLRVTATFTTLKPLKPKCARATTVHPSHTTATDGEQPDRSPSSGSAARSPPWTIVARKTPCAHSTPQQLNSGETKDQCVVDDAVPKPGTPGLASNQADRYVNLKLGQPSLLDEHRCSFPGLALRSGAYAKYVPPQRRVAGELVYTVSQRIKPTPHRSERVRFGSSSPMLEMRSRSSTLSPWSPFAPPEFPSPTSEAVAWKRGALFLPNPPPDEFAHIDELGNEKPWYARENWKTADPDDWLSGSVTEKHATGKRTVRDGEEGSQLNTHTPPQKQCHDLWKNGHRRCETFGT
ncbi:hypothetical protein DEU56DRAFT_775052 [Suillus clintonianus]|uniref:uncharacterized protein n=1 Tax=Suillus clintonianus TaxID=1904413 RepID=UPI001B8767B7|nr:uncharacterized protein DEU56DRAFT_775052 [Suillus clintonianus]KAG2153373.1 hypothetical protein DEU56DRAFT_775052 [Suillus clintonianus]